jgi:aspartyl-tRNA(Asn)/glutamyl-tRNA(Gln) amidotransferase subunit A
MTAPLEFQSLTELAAGLRRGDFSSRQLIDHFLGRIARANGKLNAYAVVYAEEARAAADAADRVRASGWPVGPLHGLPIAIKDLCDIEGRIGTVGSKQFTARRGAVTSTVVERLQSAGMIILGKAQMVEFAFGGYGTNPLCGTPWNPWDLGTHRIPGGSSSGSGVAVAAGLAPAAIGSDTGGSIRLPAGFNGIVGLKTTFGLVSVHGCFALSTTLDSLGPMTRTVEDAGLVTAAIAGPDPHDRNTLGLPAFAMPDLRQDDIRGLRIATLPEAEFPAMADEAVREAWRAACETFRGLGAVLVERSFPLDFAELVERNGRIISAEAYRIHRDYAEDPEAALGPAVRGRLLGGKGISAADYIAALEDHARAKALFADWMEDCEALLTPSTPYAAIPVAAADEAVSPAVFTRAGNYVGAAGLALPAGFSNGLPVGIQLLGKAFSERTLLRLGVAFERATGHGRRTPNLDALMGA